MIRILLKMRLRKRDKVNVNGNSNYKDIVKVNDTVDEYENDEVSVNVNIIVNVNVKAKDCGNEEAKVTGHVNGKDKVIVSVHARLKVKDNDKEIVKAVL